LRFPRISGRIAVKCACQRGFHDIQVTVSDFEKTAQHIFVIGHWSFILLLALHLHCLGVGR